MAVMIARILGLRKGEQLPCYKCGQLVPHDNSVIQFDCKLAPFGMPFQDHDCHLLPVEGKHPCIGSPSRFQYFPGYPRDPRKEYAYHGESEKAYREAYAALLAEAVTKQ